MRSTVLVLYLTSILTSVLGDVDEATVEVADEVDSVGGVWGRARDPTSPVVTLPGLGSVRGMQGKARSGKGYYQFLSIPYAGPPIMGHRFQPPRPVTPWEGIRDATVKPSVCSQMGAEGKMEGSEDCLYLNIYTRHLTPTAGRPVLVYIHGGAFIYGGTENMTGEYLMEQDMVVVTLHYRLGPLGFLTTEDSIAPGNMGLQDQIAALNWVQTYISQFGGNPKLVTLAGMSAGGASVNWLLLSPRTDGLFQRAMAMSGSALCWWANIPNQSQNARALAKEMNCPISPSSELVNCLKEKKVDEIMSAQSGLYSWHPGTKEMEPITMWSPRPDPEAGEMAVLPINPELAMEAGQIQPVPFLVGVASDEGAWRAAKYLTQDALMQEFVNNFRTLAPGALGLNGQVNEGQMKPVLVKIRDYYMGALTSETDLKVRLERTVIGMVNMLGDSMFNYPIDRMVKLQANKAHSPVWMYEYNYKHDHSLVLLEAALANKKIEEPLKNLKRSTHGGEISMMFPAFEHILGPLSEDEAKQSSKFVKFLFEFAVRGHPKQDSKYEFKEWKEVKDGQITHFVFGKYSGSQIGLPFQHRMKWWNALPVYWKKNTAPPLEVEVEDPGKVPDEVCQQQPTVEEGSRYAENVQEISDTEEIIAEELTKEELEELQVVRVIDQLKEEL